MDNTSGIDYSVAGIPNVQLNGVSNVIGAISEVVFTPLFSGDIFGSHDLSNDGRKT